MDLQTDKLAKFEFTCSNTTSISIMWNNTKCKLKLLKNNFNLYRGCKNNFNTARGTSIIATFWLADINLIMQFMNGSASKIIELIKFDANIVAMVELVLNLAAYLPMDAVGCLHK